MLNRFLFFRDFLFFIFIFIFFLESLSEEGKGEYRRGGNGPMGVYG